MPNEIHAGSGKPPNSVILEILSLVRQAVEKHTVYFQAPIDLTGKCQHRRVSPKTRDKTVI